MSVARLPLTCLLLATVTFIALSVTTSAKAARVRWCMRVVPNGELVVRYGANWCSH